MTSDQNNKQEAKDIVTAIDEYIWYVDKNPLKAKAKPAELFGTLVEILVVKGVIDIQSVNAILGTKKQEAK